MNAADPRWWQRPATWMLAITLFAGLVRLTNIDWDQRHFFHPDERRIAYAIEDLSFRPLQLNPKFFAYGSLPIYVDKIANSLLGLVDVRWRSYDSAIHTSRAVSGVIGTLTVLLIMLLGFRLYDRATGLLAGFLLAACVLHVQNSKFGCVDIALTFLVLVALYFLMGVVRRAQTRDYIYAGLAIGFAGATKASAFPMMLPLLVAAAYRWRSGDPLKLTLLRLLAAVIAISAAFTLGEPYAIVDFYSVWHAADQGSFLGNLKYFWAHAAEQSQFLHDLIEQSHMVRSAGLYPYTNQYVGTPKYAYELTQIILCGMAPPLGLAAIWATGRRVLGVWRERAEEVVLLAWVVPFFLVTGWFEVKFIRYLLPIYPLMILWAAEWTMRVSRRSGWLARLVLPGVVAGTLAALLAFLAIYTRPHTVVEASEWLYKFIPAGSKIVTQDWDEGYPMPLPGKSPERYKIVPFGYYEPDSPAKMHKLAKELSDADYVAFQTKRLYGALTQAAQKFPLSSNYFYLLFSGDLGFTLIHEVAARPSLFGIEFPDELVDESFTVYDHPKVLIFRNDGRMNAEALFNQMMHGLPSQPMTRRDLLLARPGAEVGGAVSEPIRSSIPAFLTFALLIEGLGLAAYPLVRRWLPGASPYALAKVLGVLVFAYVPWLLVSLHQADFSRGTLSVTVLIMAAIGLTVWSRQRAAGAASDIERGDWIASEALFWGAFLFFLIVRAFNPEVYWGEKPMDFSFLNTLTRATTLPPPEPWFAGHDLTYTYFGHFVSAALGKVCHLDPAVTFNLAIAFFGGLTAVAAFALGRIITGRWQLGLLAAAFTVLLGNLAGPREAFSRHSMNFDYFWANSRVIKDTINEFPLWSFLFADLHAHVMALPFSLTFLALVGAWVREQFDDVPERSSRLALLLLLGLSLGTIMVSNGWSTPTYVLIFPFLLGCHWIGSSHGRRFGTFILQAITRVVLPAVAVVVLAYAFYLPFFVQFTPPERNWGWELGTLARPRDYAQIFGLFLFVLIPFFYAVWRRLLRPQPVPVLEVVLSPATAPEPSTVSDARPEVTLLDPAPLTEVAATAPMAETAIGAEPLPVPAPPMPLTRPAWRGLGILRIMLLSLVAAGAVGSLFISTRSFLVIIGMLGFQLALSHRTAPRHRIPLAMASFAFFVTAGCDVIYIWDRMNTIFKFYLDSWLIFAAAAAAAAGALWSTDLLGPIGRRLWQAGLVALIAVAAFTGFSGTYGVLTTDRVQTPKPTLNGMLYLEERAPYELAAFNWLNQRIRGIPVILEANGPSYQEFARVSMNTGLPTVLGWEYHVIQRSATQADINRRKADIKLIYTSDNKEAVRAALERYHVALIYVGPLERRTYGGANLEQFKSWDNLLTPIYSNAAVTVFAVNGIFTGAIPVTTVEEVPRVAAEEAAPPPPDAEGQLHQPRGVATDSTGAIYVCDFGNARIQKFGPDLRFLLTWGERGELPNQFRDPCGIAVGPKDTVYVADTWNHRVQVFSADGKYQREWAASFYGPRGIAVDARGSVFVADTGNNRIVRFSPTGEQEAAWGGVGKEPGKFSEPVGITVDARGQVYVCDNANARVQIFTRDGGVVSSFPVRGWESKVYSEPNIAVDPKGTIWVTVPTEKEVRAYDASGKLLRTITGRSIPTAQFETPMGIAVSPKTKQLVISDLDHRIVNFPYAEEH